MTGAGLPLSALLSQALVAFTIECDNEFEHQMPHRTTRFGATPGATDAPWLISMAMWAHCLRHVPEEGISALELARRAQLSRRGAEMMLGRMGRRSWGYLEIAPERAGAARALTADGLRARAAYEVGVTEVEREWGRRFGRAVHAVREAAQGLAGSGTAPDSPLLAGLTPYPDGWRAQIPPPHTLPHYPFVSHRGGFPDGS